MDGWFYAQFLNTIRTAAAMALFMTPLNSLLGFIGNFLRSLVTSSGLCTPLTLEGKLPMPGQEAINLDSQMLGYLMHNVWYTSSTLLNGKMIPTGWIISRKGFGTISVFNNTSVITFNGQLTRQAMKHFAKLRENDNSGSLAMVAQDNQLSTIRVIEPGESHYSYSIPILLKSIPTHILRSQQTTMKLLASEFQRICGRQSLRGARCATTLLTGPQGCGKTIMVEQLVKHLDGFLFIVKSMSDSSLTTLRRNITLLRETGGSEGAIKGNRLREKSDYNDSDSDDDSNSTGKKKKKIDPRYRGPVVILVDEFDSVISESIPKIPALCISKMREQGLTDQEFNDAVELLQEQLANSGGSPETTKMKRQVNAFMDYLTTLDNVITVLITNSTMRQVNSSFVRDGRITHRIEMPPMNIDDVAEFTTLVSKQRGWQEVESVMKVVDALKSAIAQENALTLVAKSQTATNASAVSVGSDDDDFDDTPNANAVSVDDDDDETIDADIESSVRSIGSVAAISVDDDDDSGLSLGLGLGESKKEFKSAEFDVKDATVVDTTNEVKMPLSLATVVQILDLAKDVDDAVTKFVEAIRLPRELEEKRARNRKLIDIDKYTALAKNNKDSADNDNGGDDANSGDGNDY